MEIWQNKQIEDLEDEVWKNLVDYENFYQISSLGRVKSLRFNIIMSLGLTRGYPSCAICVQGKAKLCYVHRLVGKTFIHNKENKPYINHINGIRYDNRVANLEWTTCSENHKHAYRVLGRKPSMSMVGKTGKSNRCSRPVLQFDLNGNFIKEYSSTVDAAKHFGIRASNVSLCCHGKTKVCQGFKWQWKLGKDSYCTILQMDLNGNLIQEWKSANKIQEKTGFLVSSVLKCCHKKRKNYKGFLWKFKYD